MTETATATTSPEETSRHGEVFRRGWALVARKEIADTLRSVRFFLIVAVITIASVASIQAAASTIRDAAQGAQEDPALFLRLFTLAPEDMPSVFSFFGLVGLLAPLLGIAFGFDAISSERSQGTLPRILSHPVHRDDVINGKFAAGLAVIALTLAATMALVTGMGMWRLGITPDAGQIARLIAYLFVAVVYAGAWLAFAILCSVIFERAASSALTTIVVWLLFTIFWQLLAGLAADRIAPASEDATFQEQLRNVRLELTINRFSPQTLYEEASTALLAPDVRSLDVLLPEQVDRAVFGQLSFTQSLLIVWTQISVLVGLILGLFAYAYSLFLRQEVRA
ncbi:MAG: ABC transporter permease [Acidimicrobiales bacterium]|nr:MAG: ABC transporter permease [Acidimicrobiales bacterium]